MPCRQGQFFTTKLVGGSYPNVKQLAYQVKYASADAISADAMIFWTNEWAYKSGALDTNTLAKVNSLLSYVGGHIPSAELNFWVDQSTQTFEKAMTAILKDNK